MRELPFKGSLYPVAKLHKSDHRHIWQEYLDEAEFTRHTRRWKEIYPRRKETIERVFAENKEHHNLRFTRLRGLQKNQDQATMIFACHNLVKLARWKWNKA